MAGRKSISFRVLHPDPFEFFRFSSFAPEVHCSAEFPSKSQALKFEKFLLEFSRARYPHLEGLPSLKVLWSMPWTQVLLLPEKLKFFPELSSQMQKGLKGYSSNGFWELKGRSSKSYRWARQTQLMGVLNITPDSFFDGGRYLDPQAAVEQALRMQEEGADWIDVGGSLAVPAPNWFRSKKKKNEFSPSLRPALRPLEFPSQWIPINQRSL